VGAISPDGRLWTPVILLKITKSPKAFGILFSLVKIVYYAMLTKNGMGYMLGDFFANSSGHPAPNPKIDSGQGDQGPML
jgi:hypothetical protein